MVLLIAMNNIDHATINLAMLLVLYKVVGLSDHSENISLGGGFSMFTGEIWAPPPYHLLFKPSIIVLWPYFSALMF